MVLRRLILAGLLTAGGVLTWPFMAPGAHRLAEVFAHWRHPFALVPGRFAEALAPELTPELPQSTDYAPPEAVFIRHEVPFGGEMRVWHGLATVTVSMPPKAVVVLLHGSGRDGRAMLDMWQGVGRAEGVLLIAPDARHSAGWDPSTDGEDFLAQVLADAGIGAEVPAYLFGHSAGAEFALYLAGQGKGRWRAVAVHAGGRNVDRISAPDHPVPMRIYLGDRDQLFPVARVRREALAMAAAGHDTELVVIPDHTHWYYVIGPKVAADAWAYFLQH